jgi:threonine dehydrogenase-like Zn-dependent dehydrogenase
VTVREGYCCYLERQSLPSHRKRTLTGIHESNRHVQAGDVRAYIEELMPDILDGTVEPGRVFERTIGLDEVPDGYKAMAESSDPALGDS